MHLHDNVFCFSVIGYAVLAPNMTNMTFKYINNKNLAEQVLWLFSGLV